MRRIPDPNSIAWPLALSHDSLRKAGTKKKAAQLSIAAEGGVLVLEEDTAEYYSVFCVPFLHLVFWTTLHAFYYQFFE